MPTDSAYDGFGLPDVDLWEFMFESPRDGQFPEDKGAHIQRFVFYMRRD